MTMENNKTVIYDFLNRYEDFSKDDIENLLVLQAQPLPIDQRYGVEDMNRIIDVIKV